MPFPTPVLRANAFPSYQSKFGPKYHFQPQVAGITPKSLFRFSFKAAGFGGVALFTVIYFASGIPRVQDDIIKPLIPGMAAYYDKSVPASDSPF